MEIELAGKLFLFDDDHAEFLLSLSARGWQVRGTKLPVLLTRKGDVGEGKLSPAFFTAGKGYGLGRIAFYLRTGRIADGEVLRRLGDVNDFRRESTEVCQRSVIGKENAGNLKPRVAQAEGVFPAGNGRYTAYLQFPRSSRVGAEAIGTYRSKEQAEAALSEGRQYAK